LPIEKGSSSRRTSSSRGGASEETATRGSEKDRTYIESKGDKIVESSGELDQAPLAEKTCVELVRKEIAAEARAWSDL
jgi:hypothetical protein